MWRLPSLLYADDLVLHAQSEKELREMWSTLLRCRKRGLKVNAGKSKVMVLGGEEGLECEVCTDGICLEYLII